MALRKIGGNLGGPIFKWDAIGKSIKGFLLQLRDGKQFPNQAQRSKLATFKLLDGQVVTSGAPKVLADGLASIAIGAYVEITYLGVATGQTGSQYKSFNVEGDDEKRISPQEVAQAIAAAAQKTQQPAAAPNGWPSQPTPAASPFVQTAPSAATSTTAAGVDPVAALEQKLRETKGNQIGDLMVNALKSRYPDPIAYLGALSDTLKAAGVAV